MSFVLTSRENASDPELTLPAAPAERKKATIPLAAAVVPILGGVGMFVMTGSVIALMFAALGPVMVLATLADGARGRRRDRRQYRRDIRRAEAQVRAGIDAHHDHERELRWRTHPDVAHLCSYPDDVWRMHPQRDGTLVVGSGSVGIGLEVARGTDTVEARDLRAYASVLTGAPLVIGLDGGICVRGEPVVARAVHRALVTQLCASHDPAVLRVVLGSDAEPWLTTLPHVQYSPAERVVTVSGAREAGVSDAPGSLMLAWSGPDDPPPLGCRTLLDVSSDLSAELVRDSLRYALEVEAISLQQAAAVAHDLAEKSSDARTTEDIVWLSELRHPRTNYREGLPVMVGRSSGSDVRVDIVADGPHGVVVGTTGSGKSELLVSWVLALCATYTPDEVTFLLVDFKGGTAFDPLNVLPHVTGIVTDLSGSIAKRALVSLQAEIRRREAAIAAAGARDITDARVALPRLLIMVDEFAAMVRQFPDLDAVFTDIAARGRALGMHLVIGAQRAAGSIRDATLANAPLRIALRVTDATDSRSIIGTDAAAHISGGADGKGAAYVRRSADATASRFRVALSQSSDIDAIVRHYPHAAGARSTWWDPLPTTISLADVPARSRGVAVGLGDDTEGLRRVPVVIEPGVERGWWVLGGPRSGKTSLIETLAATEPGAVRVPADGEGAWDCLAWLETARVPLVLWDDVDTTLAAWPDPWSRDGAERLERLVRTAGTRGQTWVLTAQRASGILTRIADLLPGRVLFAVPSKLDHVAAGGASADHDPQRPPGRALMAGTDVQFAILPERLSAAPTTRVPRFEPVSTALGIITRRAFSSVAEALAAADVGTAQPVLDAVITDQEAPQPTLVGDPEAWQRNYAALEFVKRHGTILVATECAADIRVLLGSRELVPYAEPGRYWAFSASDGPRRVTL